MTDCQGALRRSVRHLEMRRAGIMRQSLAIPCYPSMPKAPIFLTSVRYGGIGRARTEKALRRWRPAPAPNATLAFGCMSACSPAHELSDDNIPSTVHGFCFSRRTTARWRDNGTSNSLRTDSAYLEAAQQPGRGDIWVAQWAILSLTVHMAAHVVWPPVTQDQIHHVLKGPRQGTRAHI